jgi:RNA polymerase sigma-70 factor, ECF subfamily
VDEQPAPTNRNEFSYNEFLFMDGTTQPHKPSLLQVRSPQPLGGGRDVREAVPLLDGTLSAEQEALEQRRHDFEREAVPFMDGVYHFSYNLTGNADDAQDLVQETFLKAFRFFDSFQQGTNCKAWLFQIAKNSFINRYRKQSREPDKVRYDDIEEYYEVLRPDNVEANDLELDVFKNLLDDEITTALQALPESFRSVIILSDIESLTYEEIAEVLDCPIGTVRSRLHRARKILRDTLLEYARAKGFKTNTSDTATNVLDNNKQ